jgi:FAD binding domain
MIRKGFVLFFPMEGKNHYRIVGVLPDVTNAEEKFRFDSIAGMINAQIISPVDFKELRWFSTYKVHSRKANSFMKGRCFIAGDAAHIHTPAGGQGMNTGIQDAYNLAWKLAYRIRGEVNEEVLKTYDTERRENAKHLLQTTDRMFDIMSGVNRFWNFIRLNFLAAFLGLIVKSSFVRKRIFPLISQTGISYPHSFLTEKSSVGRLRAGERMSYFVFSDGREIFSYLTEPVFKLLFFGEDKQADRLTESRIKLNFISFKEIPESIFGSATNFYILLRPDNHISYIGKDIQKCKALLNKITYH